jgi:adhesin/invasin
VINLVRHPAVRTSSILCGIVVFVGCGETTVNVPLPAAAIAGASTNLLTGPVGQALPSPIAVTVFGSDDQPLPGAQVTFSAANGGSVDPAAATTDLDGVARTRWTLGPDVGANVLTVTAGSVSTTLTATASAGPPATVTLVVGDNQTAAAGTAVSVAPAVRVADAFGNLAAGVAVTFSVLSGGGRVTNGLRATDGQGVATVGSWILGSAAGTQTLAARVEANGVANNPIVFSATATARVGSQMTVSAGDNQHAPVGHVVPVAPAVVVKDPSGAPVPGVVVTFAVGSGGGAVIGGRQTTDALGIAAVGGWFLGDLPGTNTLTAAAVGLQSVTFTAIADPGVPVSLVAISPTTQSAAAGTKVASPPSVVVRDVTGSPVPGVSVAFTVAAGGGTVVGSPALTNASGVATVTSWTLGSATGPNTVVASAAGLPTATFNATGTAGAAAAVVATVGDNQTAVQGTGVAQLPTVKVTDAGGNPVAGAAVTFAVILGGGAAVGLNQTTDALGLATVGGWILGAAAPNTLRATVTGTGVTGNPVTFTAQSATQIGITSAPAGPITLGTNFTITVQLRNVLGASVPLAGIPLTIVIASGGGTLNGALVHATDASGAASFTVNVTGAAGARTFSVTGTGLVTATTAAITIN